MAKRTVKHVTISTLGANVVAFGVNVHRVAIHVGSTSVNPQTFMFGEEITAASKGIMITPNVLNNAITRELIGDLIMAPVNVWVAGLSPIELIEISEFPDGQ